MGVGQPSNEFKEEVKPIEGEPVFSKAVNSDFISAGLQAYLEAQQIQSLVIVGLTTDHCVSTTARMAGNLGFETYLLANATATFDKIGFDGQHYLAELVHQTELASLHTGFATVLRTEQVIELVRSIGARPAPGPLSVIHRSIPLPCTLHSSSLPSART